MDLEGSLRCIQSLSDLPPLVALLGHQPLWEAVPDNAWGRQGRAPLKVMALGLAGKVPWLGVASTHPLHDARLLARRVCRRGKVAVVVALDRETRRMGVAAAFDRCPGQELSLSHPDPEAVAALARLAGVPEGGDLAYAARAAEALAAEPVSQRFFRAFRLTLDRMGCGLPAPVAARDRQSLVLLQLTRVLFLYFIQAKGWLDGRERFLEEEIDRCLSRRRRIHRDVLRPLFFGTLNQPIGQRTGGARRFGALPFLNGGLFEPHPLERRCHCDISNALWREAFGDLFERFHFTVAEGRHRGSVAPDMLGRVFEGVMEPEARKSSGTFYTPAALVSRVLDAALIALVSRRTNCTEAQADRRLSDRDPQLGKLLKSITILDPAAGSGAFLLCALERLSGLAESLRGITARKRHILEQNLFGVDRNATAVRLAELRLWLAVIADDPADRPDQVHPLPNLDCLIRQGDSLFEPTGLELTDHPAQPDPEITVELSKLRRQVVTATGASKRHLVRQLHAAELRAVARSLDVAEQRHLHGIEECVQHARSRDLFGHIRGVDLELRRRLSELRTSLRELRRARRRLMREGEVPWFHYQSHFADVFSKGGFDLVVGNPPWLRSESIPAPMRQRLSGRYRWWRAKGHSYGNSPDLAVAFLERAFELSAPNGVVAMLIPAKLAATSCSAAARHALATGTTLHVVADLTGTPEASFGATVYPLALVASKAPPLQHHRVRTQLVCPGGPLIAQSELSGGFPWVLIPGLHQIVRRLEHSYPTLGERTRCQLGVKTGMNRVFLNPPADLEPHLLSWAVRGRDVRAFRCHPRMTLLWVHDGSGQPLNELPPRTAAYLAQFAAALRARRDYTGGPSWTVFRTRAAVARYRVVWPDLARRLTAVALTSKREGKRIPLNSCYVAPVRSASRAHALAAWLNSTWIRALARLRAVPASGGFARFNADVVSALPLPDVALVDPTLTRIGRAGRAGAPIQDELDRLTARHLSLCPSDQSALRAVVDSSADHRCLVADRRTGRAVDSLTPWPDSIGPSRGCVTRSQHRTAGKAGRGTIMALAGTGTELPAGTPGTGALSRCAPGRPGRQWENVRRSGRSRDGEARTHGVSGSRHTDGPMEDYGRPARNTACALLSRAGESGTPPRPVARARHHR